MPSSILHAARIFPIALDAQLTLHYPIPCPTRTATCNWYAFLEDLKQAGLRRLDVAAMAGVTPNMIAHVSGGRRQLSPATRFLLLFQLGIHFDYSGRGAQLAEVRELILDLERQLIAAYPDT